MKRIAVTLTLLCLMVVGTGCPKKPLPPGMIVADKQVAIANMKPEDVIISVNGQALTRQAFDDNVDLYVTFYTFKKPTADAPTLNAYRTSRGARVIPEYMIKQLILQEGKRLGIRLSAEELAAAERRVWQEVAPRRTGGEDFAATLGAKTALFKQHVAEDEYVKATRKAVFGERLVISEEEVDALVKKRADWNAVYAESNRVVMARGEGIVRELRAGADFAEMARKVSQHRPEEGVEWGTFTPSEIEDPKLRAAAFELPVGAISDPIDTEGGLLIIRVLDRTEGAMTDSAVAIQVATVKLAKILLLLYNPVEEMSRAQLRAMMERERISELQKEWVPTLHAAARIEYPNGTNLWPKAKGTQKKTRQSSLQGHAET